MSNFNFSVIRKNTFIRLLYLLFFSYLSAFAVAGGYNVSFVEVAGQFSGVIFGIGMILSAIPSYLVPYLIGVLTKHVSLSLIKAKDKIQGQSKMRFSRD